ncbi:nucleotide exchange factor GrpE [Paenibacillus sp. 481]|uniref:nucleotide exchange factor GrpE n=1 Tax=Paenibacillus sp. 481 TaxID=2835869 RepID=UPI001E58A4CE|nr:nucleotide exchange factor GrpE [Paenibacillus sp. 481]UHA74197.1 nucleotide exchange factor GrpE [Paenibacillus sp. 481]
MNQEQAEKKVAGEDVNVDANLEQQEGNVEGNEDSQSAQHEANSEGNSELERVKAESDEHYQRYLRAQADFDNFRRRTVKEKEELAKYASLKLVTELVPVLDNFERALATNPANEESDSFVKGVNMIFRQISQVLEQEGVQPMNSVGQPFNPEYHQAIMQVESDEYEEGIVVEEVQRGYMLKDRVLRPAMVKVSG